MKLSEAIREGARLAPQAFGMMFVKGGTCAIGAAAEHLWMVGKLSMSNPTFASFDHLEPFFPLMTRRGVKLPCHCKYVNTHDVMMSEEYAETVSLFIAHLNDIHRWSREAIAEWVETIEKNLETEQAPGPRLGEPNAVRTEACEVGSLDCTPVLQK